MAPPTTLIPTNITMSDCVRSDVAMLEAIACEISVLLSLERPLAMGDTSRETNRAKPDPTASSNAGRRTVLTLLGAVK